MTDSYFAFKGKKAKGMDGHNQKPRSNRKHENPIAHYEVTKAESSVEAGVGEWFARGSIENKFSIKKMRI